MQHYMRTTIIACLMVGCFAQTADTSPEEQLDYNKLYKIYVLSTVAASVGSHVFPPAYRKIKYLYDRYVHDKTYVGTISVHGTIGDAKTYVDRIQEMFERDDVDMLMLDIESGGGKSGSSEVVFHEIRRMRTVYNKPIIAWVENQCASGAYHIAAACDYIITTPSALIGSIGVMIPQWHAHRFINRYDLDYDTVQAGDYKSATNPLTPQQDHEREMLQNAVDRTYQQFINNLRIARPQLEDVDATVWANAQLFNGEDARHKGLVDAVGANATITSYVRSTMGRTGDIVYVTPLSEQPTLFGNLQHMLIATSDHVVDKLQTQNSISIF